LGRIRLICALAIALTAMLPMAAPAAALTTLDPCKGTCGNHSGQDTAGGPWGATCKFADDMWLHQIKVRPPTVFGSTSSKRKVGWRYKVFGGLTNANTSDLVFTSGWQTAQASDSASARKDHGFSNRTYSFPVIPPGFFWYRVVVEMGWWNGTNRVGLASSEYDWYRLVNVGVPGGEAENACSWTSE
jgi:hypothetical protein